MCLISGFFKVDVSKSNIFGNQKISLVETCTKHVSESFNVNMMYNYIQESRIMLFVHTFIHYLINLYVV